VLGVTALAKDGEPSILYAIFDRFSGQCIEQRASARLEDFNRYMKAGELYWQG